ncbi:MAG: amidohydrolase family protein, partial [Candidatus Geothermarchaeales archaeon]
MNVSLKSDLAVVNAEVVSLDGDGPVAEAVAAREGFIVYVGDNAGVKSFVGPGTEILDAEGHALVPGLIDSHIHLIWFGFSLQRLDLREVDSIENLKKVVASKAGELEDGEWILGGWWDQERFKEERYPNRWDLDEAAPRHPVLLHRVCSHIGVANSSALDLLGISEETPDPPGGTIDRNKDTG